MAWFVWWIAACSALRTHRLNLKEVAVCRGKGAPRHMKHADCRLDEEHGLWGSWSSCRTQNITMRCCTCFGKIIKKSDANKASHLSPGTTCLCSTPGSSSFYEIHHGHSKCKAWTRLRWHSGLPWPWGDRHRDLHSEAPGTVAETRHPRAPLGPGSASL